MRRRCPHVPARLLVDRRAGNGASFLLLECTCMRVSVREVQRAGGPTPVVGVGSASWGRRAPQSRHGAAWSELCRDCLQDRAWEAGGCLVEREGRGTEQLWAGPGGGTGAWGTIPPSSSGVLLDELQM